MIEDINKDYKSLRKAIGDKSRLRELAETCVCFANAQGGEIIIGIEDKDSGPPGNQKLDQEKINKVVKTLRGLTDGVGLVNPEIIRHENGGEYFIIRVLPSTRTIATTSTGKVLIRVSDNCFHASSDEMTNLAAEKTAFQWEIAVVQKIHIHDVTQVQVNNFLQDLKYNGKSKISKIQSRLKEISAKDIQKTVYKMTENGKLIKEGGKRNRTYSLSKKNKLKIN